MVREQPSGVRRDQADGRRIAAGRIPLALSTEAVLLPEHSLV